MKLSILIPMYNASAYIARCLDSLLNQGLLPEDYEILIMDDGSQDNSVEIVQEYCYRHKHIYLFVEANAGAYPTRNKLFQYANGEYIYCMDADDYLVSNALDPILKYAYQYDVDFLGFDTVETAEQDLFALKKESLEKKLFNLKIVKGINFLLEKEDLRSEIWWYLFKKQLLIDNDISFTSNRNNADVVFTLRVLLESKRIVYLPFKVHRYFQSENSIMRRRDRNSKIEVVNTMFQMTLEYSFFIEKLVLSGCKEKAKTVNKLRKSRDKFVFHNLIEMIRLGFSATELKERIKQLNSVKAFPVSNYIGPNNSWMYRIINIALKDRRNIIAASSLFQLKNRIQL